ncbi:MAG: DNRLRE domain-containing protein [bacterium]|nr:DNRLRE domain-containing protein [bacterium]
MKSINKSIMIFLMACVMALSFGKGEFSTSKSEISEYGFTGKGAEIDTVFINNSTTSVKAKGGSVLSIQQGKNYFDKRQDRFRKRELRFNEIQGDEEEERIIEADAEYNYFISSDIMLFMNGSDLKTRIESYDGHYVEYTALEINKGITNNHKQESPDLKLEEVWDGVDITLTPTDRGYKEHIVLKNEISPGTFKYLISSSIKCRLEGKELIFGDIFKTVIYAFDGTGEDIPVEINITGDTLEISVTKDNAVYPIIIDPGIEWQYGSDDGQDTYIYNRSGYETNNYGEQSYLTIRSYSVNGKFRSLVRFDSLKCRIDTVLNSQIVDSAFLSFVIKDIQSAADTLFIASLTSIWSESAASWDSSKTGTLWSSAGGDFAGPPYIDTVFVNSLSIGDTFRFEVTSSIDSMINWNAPNYGWILIAGNEENTDSNYLVELYSSDHSVPGDRPKLEVYYRNTTTPHSIVIDSQFYNGVIVSGVDILGVSSYKAVFGDSISNIFGDTIYTNGIDPDTLCDTLTINGRYDSLLHISLAVWDTNGVKHGSEDYAEFYTCAQRTTSVSAVDTSDSTITFYFGADSNPGSVQYQLYDSSKGCFFDTSGSVVPLDSSWYLKSEWDEVTIHTNINTLHIIYVNSRNTDSLETGLCFNDSIWSWAQVPEIDTVYAVSRDSILISIDPVSNPFYTFYAIEDSVSGRFADWSAHIFRSSDVTVDSVWAWGSYSDWGGASGIYIRVDPDTKYVLRIYSKDGNKRDK